MYTQNSKMAMTRLFKDNSTLPSGVPLINKPQNNRTHTLYQHQSIEYSRFEVKLSRYKLGQCLQLRCPTSDSGKIHRLIPTLKVYFVNKFSF